MELGIGAFILIVLILAAYKLSTRYAKKHKYLVWGIAIMIALGPLASWLIGRVYGDFEQNGWAGAAVIMILYGLTFLTGVIFLLIGIFSKQDSHAPPRT